MKKKLLILRACGHVDEKEECNGISGQAQLYGLDVTDTCPKDEDELKAAIYSGEKYDYIYLSSHGSEWYFANHAGTMQVSWGQFGYMLCESDCMNPGCTVLLSCCRGGLDQVAYGLFNSCLKISYIVGPRQSLNSYEMLTSFNIFLFSHIVRGMDPVVACDKILAATDIRFKCFDRVETAFERNQIQFMQARFSIEGNLDLIKNELATMRRLMFPVPTEVQEMRQTKLDRIVAVDTHKN